MPSGTGFFGGYGRIRRSAYATPIELGYKPWTFEFTFDAGAKPAYPNDKYIDPIANNIQWRTEDWDPGLRFWTLPFDPQLTEWLQDLDLGAPSAMAAREFAYQHASWQANQATLISRDWIKAADLAWQTSWTAVQGDLDDLQTMMAEARARYLAESLGQADGIPRYFVHLLGIDRASKPWTIHLIRCGLAIGNLVYMHYKAQFKRVRPSYLCPGLAPPFGPPRHPAFPSGHSFLGHFIALLLLEIPEVAQRYGIGMSIAGNAGTKPTWANYRAGSHWKDGALLWLADRLATNRERMGLHYPTDSSAARQLAGGIWNAVLDPAAAVRIEVPTLAKVLSRARSEWTRP